jgi:NAD(P)-dependent dehydrogenase (short-subunit alcohol dehydrogenase family)
VSSRTHHTGEIDLNDLHSRRSYRLGGFGVYATSKLANVFFTYELARRLADSHVTVNAMAPGNVATGFGHNNRGPMGMVVNVLHLFARTPEKGAETVIYLAASPAVAGVSGKYYEDCQPVATSKASLDTTLARKLWEASEAMVGVLQPA